MFLVEIVGIEQELLPNAWVFLRLAHQFLEDRLYKGMADIETLVELSFEVGVFIDFQF